MVRRSRGSRSKTRKLLRIRGKARGVPPSQILKSFEIGEKAVIKISPSIQKGMPHPRFYGKLGTVVEKRGRCYVLEVMDGEKMKMLVAAPVHLRKLATPVLISQR